MPLKYLSLCVVALVVFIGTIAVFTRSTPHQPVGIQDSPGVPASHTSDWQTHVDTEHGFSLRYPAQWDVLERHEITGLPLTRALIPTHLDTFPECKRREERSLEHYATYQTPEAYRENISSIRTHTRTETCGIGITVEENPERLSIKEFLKKGFTEGSATTLGSRNEIEQLETQVLDDNTERGVSRTSFYLRGFGFGHEGDVVPGMIPDTEQYIVAHDAIIIFISNNINAAGASLPENEAIFKGVIESLVLM